MSDLYVASAKGIDEMLETDIISRFNGIYDATNKPILAFITAKCGKTSDINDIFQDTYMELYKILSKHGAGYVTNGKAYVFRIAKNQIAKHYSLLKRLQMFVSMTVKDEEIELSNTDIESFLTDDSMEDYIVNKILVEDLWQHIQKKSEEVKKIFYLFYDVGLTIPEIAQMLSLKESSVKNKIYRTVKELQNLLKKEGNQHEEK